MNLFNNLYLTFVLYTSFQLEVVQYWLGIYLV